MKMMRMTWLHDDDDDGAVAQSDWRPWLVARASLGEQRSKVFQLELRGTLRLNAERGCAIT